MKRLSRQSIPKFFKDTQNIIAVCLTVISLCALIMSMIQTSLMREERELMREYSRASVWPRLEYGIEKGYSPKDKNLNHFSLKISNSGIGPAIITDVRIKYNEIVANDWWHLFEIQNIPDSIDKQIFNQGFNGRIIKIGETLEILNLDDNLTLANAFIEKFQDVSIEIYYESIYKEKWKWDYGTTTQLESFTGLPEEEQFW